MKRYLFAGPTVPDADQVLAGTDVTVLPPVAGGDLLRLAPGPGDVVGIVDGYFHQVGAVRHKEILAVLEGGTAVYGAASIGALRAAELDSFGMRGVGGVYRDYRDGRLAADDEVALLHAPAEGGYAPLSEPLVNIRATLDVAVQEGVLDPDVSARLVRELGQRPYRLRSYPRLVELAEDIGLSTGTVEALRTLCATRPVNRKRADALSLIDVLRSAAPPRHPPGVTVARTVFLHRWEVAARDVHTGAGQVVGLAALRMCQLFAGDYPAFHADLVFGYLSRECARSCDPAPGPDPVTTALDHAVHRGVIPAGAERPEQLPFLDLWLTPEERQRWDLRTQLARFLVRSFQIGPGVGADALALDALRDRPAAAGGAAELVAAARSVNDEARRIRPDFDPLALSADRVLEYVRNRWDVPAAALELAALDRGIGPPDALVAAARPYYLLAKYNPARTDLRMCPAETATAGPEPTSG